jgi:type IV secretory pathway TraG/TraD family ATPase VirD4
MESKNPIRCNKIMYYKDKMFTNRLLEKTSVPKQEPFIAKTKPKTTEEAKPQ